ncbi:MAG TPA: YwqG family protein [Vicinamibacteria bacterium]
MPQSLEELLVASGMPRETARKLGTLPLPAVRLSSRRVAQESDIPLGASRLGGRPDLKPGFSWPSWKDRPLSFVGQVNLADVAPYPFCSRLPSSGLLSFFYDQDQQTWGFDPKDRGSWLVHFEPDPSLLERGAPPGGASSPSAFPASTLEPSEVETLPAVDSQLVSDLGLRPEELDAYSQVLDQAAEQGPPGTAHQLLGHASPVQGDMQLECQLVSHGLYCGDQTGYTDPRAQALKAGAKNWRLLMQIDTDDDGGMMWGDCGRLYFWMTDDALQRRAFDECWMILQCS